MHLASKKGLVDDEPKADNAVATYGDTGTARSPAAVRENEHALTSPPPPHPHFSFTSGKFVPLLALISQL